MERDLIQMIVGAAVVGTISFIGWLWKQSIYGRFEQIEKMILENRSYSHEMFDKKMDQASCNILREGCRNRLDEIVERVTERLSDQGISLEKKMDLMNQRLIQLIERFDKHIDETRRSR